MKFSIERLRRFFLYSPALYSSVVWRPYGLLFRDPQNAACHDANHGVILDLSCDLDAALADVEKFYRARCMAPRVYGGFLPGEDALVSALKERGYAVSFFEGEATMELLAEPSGLFPNRQAVFERPKELTMELSALLSRNLGPWALGMEELLLSRPDCRGYLLRTPEGQAAAYCTVLRNGDCAYLQNLFTVPEFRRQGYCATLLTHVLSDHRTDCPGLPLYLSAVEPSAIRLYERAGFRAVPYPYPLWTAAKEGEEA